MKTSIVKIFFSFIGFVSLFASANAQECNMLAPGSDAGFDQMGFCAPVTGRVKYFTFYAITEIPVSSLKVEVNWGVGKKRYDVTSLGYDADLQMYAYQMPEATHVYTEERTNPKCSYPVTVQAVVNGKLCGAPKQSGTVIVWDKDDANGGNLLLDPTTYYACPGTEFSVNFNDESTWNCVPPKEKININWPKRTTQFVYGTQNTITGIVKVGETAVSSLPLEGPYQEYNDKVQKPGGPFSQSAKITIPATAKVGEKFEVTLNNWNYCNQLPEAPIQRKAIIEIVAQPKGTITIKDKEDFSVEAFCPGEEVKLYGSYFTEAGTVLPSDVRYDWTVTDFNTGDVQKFENQKDVVLTNGFSKPGSQKVALTVSNKTTNTIACTNVVEKTIAVIDAPAVQTTLNDVVSKDLFFCAEDPSNVYYEVAFKHSLTSNEDFTYAYNLFKRNSTKTSPDSTLNFIGGTGIKQVKKQEAYHAIYTKPGLYRIQVWAKNNRTGCVTVEENNVAIYEKPLPNFSVAGLCAGSPTQFTNKSSVSNSVPGDKLVKWEWDLNYTKENSDNSTFDTDKTGKSISWMFTEPGTYNVALRVTTLAGCDTIAIKTIDIKPTPVALLSSNYSGGLICPGDTIRFNNNSIETNNGGVFPAGVSYKLFISDSIATKEIPLSAGQVSIDYASFFNPSDSVETYTAWLEAKGNDPNNCAVNSAPVLIKVRSGAAAGYTTIPSYSPFEPNCSPKTLRFVTNKATQDLLADSYKWTIIFQGEIKQEIYKDRLTGGAFDTLDYTFGNETSKYLDYEVMLTVEKEGICVIPSRNTFRIYPNPKPQFSVTPVLQACDSTVFELKVGIPTGISDYSWEFSPSLPVNDGQTGVKDDQFFIAYSRPAYGTDPVEYTVKLKAKNFYGCEGEWMETITVNPVVMEKPVLELTSVDGNGCKPMTATFTNKTIANPVTATYEFFVENKATGKLAKVDPADIKGDLKTTFSYTFKASGDFEAFLQGTAPLEGGSCMRPLSNPIAISVKKDPSANFTVYPTEDCGSLTAVIAKTSLDGSLNTWTISNKETGEILHGPITSVAKDDSFNQYTFQNTSNKTQYYSIKLTTENEDGCTASDSIMVTVYPTPKAYFNVVADVCDPHTVTIDHQVADNPGDLTYTWLWGDGTSSEGMDPEPHHYSNTSYTKALHYNIKLIAKSTNGCTADSTIRIVVHPRVKADFEADVLTGCAPLNVNFTNKSLGSDDNYSGWYIKKEGESNFTFVSNTLLQSTFENNGTTVRTFEVMYKAKNAGGCADSVVKEIKVQPQVIADFSVSPSANAYSGTDIQFTIDKVIPGIKYTWNWGDGSAPLVATNNELSHRYENRTVNNHYYEVTLTAEDAVYGCKSSKTVIVTVYPEISLSLTARKDTVCMPEVPEFDVIAQNTKSHYWYTGEKGKVDYSQRLNDVYDPRLFENKTNKPLTYEVVYVGISAEGNKDSIATKMVVYPAIKPGFTIDGLNKTLPDALFTITNTTPGADAWITSWDFGNGQISDKVNPGAVRYDTFGNFTITMTISNGFCSAEYAVRVQVADAVPDISFDMEHIEGCWPITVKFQNTSEFTDETKYFWDFGDGIGTSTAIHPTYTYNKPGNYKVTLNAFNRTGEENANHTSEKVIRVYAQPTPDFVVRKELVYVPEEPVYVANYSERGVWYRWDFGDGTIYEGPDQFEPVHYYKNPGQYNIKLVVQSEHGCVDSVTVLRAVTAEGGGTVTIPNAFTPNLSGSSGGHVGEGDINDVFHPVFKGTVLNYHMLIYNRWGELVFETKDTQLGWDGYYKNKICSSGIYLYKISAKMSDGRAINKIGDIMLIQ